MGKYMLITLWVDILLPISINAGENHNSITNLNRFKRSFGFGFSNPIFSRVFNPYDNRPLSAKFFGDRYASQPTYNYHFGGSHYQYNPWNHDAWSDIEKDYGQDSEEENLHSYRNHEWPDIQNKFPSKPYSRNVLKNQKSKDVHTPVRTQNSTTSRVEHAFKLLPIYDIAKPFRTLTEIKKLNDIRNSLKLKIKPLKETTMEYIFNLLPHYDIRNKFRSSSPSGKTFLDATGSRKNIDKTSLKGFSRSFDWPIDSVVKSSNLNYVTTQETKTNTFQTGVSTNTSPSSRESKLTFVLPNKSLAQIFRENLKQPALVSSVPAFLPKESGTKTTIPFYKDQISIPERKVEKILNVTVYESDISESKVTLPKTEKPEHQFEIVHKFVHDNSDQVNSTKSFKILDKYVPHRTKIFESYSQFLSLPSVTIYQRFNNSENIPVIGNKPLSNTPTGQIFVSRSEEQSDKFSETVSNPTIFLDKSLDKQSSTSLSNPTPEMNDSISQIFKNGNRSKVYKKGFQKIESFTQRNLVEFTSEAQTVIHFPKVSSMVNVSIPNERKILLYGKKEVDKEKYQIVNHLIKKPGNSRNDKNLHSYNSELTYNSSRPEKHFPMQTTITFPINRFNPNVTQSNRQVQRTRNKEEKDISEVKYFTRSVSVEPIRADMPEKISLLTDDVISDEAEFTQRLAPQRNILLTVPRFESNSRRKLKQISVLSPVNSVNSKYLKVHHVQRKPLSVSNFTAVDSESMAIRDSSDQIILNDNNRHSLTFSEKENSTNIPHKRRRTDVKRLPAEKTITFRALPYYDNKGLKFSQKIEYEIVDNESKNLKNQEIQNVLRGDIEE